MHPLIRVRDAKRRRGEFLVVVLVVQDGDADVVQVVLALRPCSGLADLLHGGEQKSHQHRDDRDDYQKLDEREREPGRRTMATQHDVSPDRAGRRGSERSARRTRSTRNMNETTSGENDWACAT